MVFAIYKDPKWGDSDVPYSHEAVKHGISLSAWFLGPVWALMKGLWGISALLFVILLAVFLFAFIEGWSQTSISEAARTLRIAAQWLYGGLALLLTIAGNRLRIARLEREGYELVDTVEADSEQSALAPYLKANER